MEFTNEFPCEVHIVNQPVPLKDAPVMPTTPKIPLGDFGNLVQYPLKDKWRTT